MNVLERPINLSYCYQGWENTIILTHMWEAWFSVWVGWLVWSSACVMPYVQPHVLVSTLGYLIADVRLYEIITYWLQSLIPIADYCNDMLDDSLLVLVPQEGKAANHLQTAPLWPLDERAGGKKNTPSTSSHLNSLVLRNGYLQLPASSALPHLNI